MNLADLVYAGFPLGVVGLLCGGIVAAVCGLRRAYLNQTAPATADWPPVDERGRQLVCIDPLPSGLIGGHEDTPLDEDELRDLGVTREAAYSAAYFPPVSPGRGVCDICGEVFTSSSHHSHAPAAAPYDQEAEQ